MKGDTGSSTHFSDRMRNFREKMDRGNEDLCEDFRSLSIHLFIYFCDGVEVVDWCRPAGELVQIGAERVANSCCSTQSRSRRVA